MVLNTLELEQVLPFILLPCFFGMSYVCWSNIRHGVSGAGQRIPSRRNHYRNSSPRTNALTKEEKERRDKLISDSLEFQTIVSFPSKRPTGLHVSLVFQQGPSKESQEEETTCDQRDLESGDHKEMPQSPSRSVKTEATINSSSSSSSDDNEESEDDNYDSNSDSEPEIQSSPEDIFNPMGGINTNPNDISHHECCSICLEPYVVGDVVARLKHKMATMTTEKTQTAASHCNHCFHKECILGWLQNHHECPLCRVDMIHPHQPASINANLNGDEADMDDG